MIAKDSEEKEIRTTVLLEMDLIGIKKAIHRLALLFWTAGWLFTVGAKSAECMLEVAKYDSWTQIAYFTIHFFFWPAYLGDFLFPPFPC